MDFKLTKDNYFSPDRPHISSSQIKDYLLSPSLYKRRHIDHDPDSQKEITSAMLVGTVVDDLLTEGVTGFSKAVLKRDDPELFELQKLHPENVVSASAWDAAMLLAREIPKHPLWQSIKEQSKMQVVLEGEAPFGALICGKLDALTSNGDIIDLKCSSEGNARDGRTWKYFCLRSGYHIQAAMYRWLNKGAGRFIHVVAYIKDGVVVVKAYEMPKSMIDEGMGLILRALGDIKYGQFKDKLTCWADIEMLDWQTPVAEIPEEEPVNEFR